MFDFAIIILFVAAFLFISGGFILFDKILKFQYKNYYEEWKNDGEAIGCLWKPAEAKLFSGWVSRNAMMMSWTFGSADWMKNEQKIQRSALLMRLSFISAWLLMFALIVLHFAKP